MDSSDSEHAVFKTDLALPEPGSGKVRDTYRLPADPLDRLLIVATDRISAFDVVLPTPVPGKGRLLTEIACFWLDFIASSGISRTHVVSTDPADVPPQAFSGHTGRADLAGRVTIGRRCRVIPVECVVRGYLEGSGWRDYLRTGAVCGIALPEGLRQCDRLEQPIFTPATKAEQGAHDENIGLDEAAAIAGGTLMETLRERSLAIYRAAAAHALERGIILADTKFEFGLPVDDAGRVIDDDPIVIDEALTPDSSRFWPADRYEPGHAQPSFDKQFVREYLESLARSGGWDKTAPGPALPTEVVAGTLARYREARDRLLA